MARGLAEKAKTKKLQNQAVPSAGQDKSICSRCGGLMVIDFCMDLLSSTGELEFAATRCVQCGEVVDPVIQRNRQVWKELMTMRPFGATVQSIGSQVQS